MHVVFLKIINSDQMPSNTKRLLGICHIVSLVQLCRIFILCYEAKRVPHDSSYCTRCLLRYHLYPLGPRAIPTMWKFCKQHDHLYILPGIVIVKSKCLCILSDHFHSEILSFSEYIWCMFFHRKFWKLKYLLIWWIDDWLKRRALISLWRAKYRRLLHLL